MTNDRLHTRISWLGRIWGIAGIRWLIRLVTLGVAVASFLVIAGASGPVRLIASVILTAIVLAAGAQQAADMVRSVRAYQWGRWGRFAWMRFVALIAGVLVVLSPLYMLLVIIYPALRPTPMTSMALATILALAALALALLALTALSVVVVLLWLPVAITRSHVRERRRRHYRFPTR